MSDERPKSEVKITGDGNVVGDGSSSQVVKAESDATIGSVTQIGKVVTQLLGRGIDKERAQRNRRAMLEMVKTFWVKGVLEQSLHGAAMIELGLEERADAVEHPWDMVLQTEREERALPPGARIIDVFDEMGRNLLVLGAPGSGKTTMLLELARDTIARAEQDLSQPIPVVFNLTSWADKRQPIAEWLVEELNTKYNIPKRVARPWVENDDLLLLLDGLDEVKLEHREACVKAINDFRQEHGLIPLVVCSRIADYEALTTKLKLQGAVLVQPLTPQQVDEYLRGAGMALSAVRETLQHDPTLQEVAETPLMLSVMALAYQGRSVEDLQTLETTVARRKHVFESYVQRMFERRRVDHPYSPQQTIQWLAWLAQKMSQYSQTVFFIERMQPRWLRAGVQLGLYGAIAGLILGLAAGCFVGLAVGLGFGLFVGLLSGLFSASVLGLSGILDALSNKYIRPVEVVRWSWRRAGLGLILGCLMVLALEVCQWTGGLLVSDAGDTLDPFRVPQMVFFALFMVVAEGLIVSEIEIRSVPNQGIRQSARNAAIIGLFCGAIGGMIAWLAWGLDAGVAAGSSAGLIACVLGGGWACIQHFALRMICSQNDYAPWNYARFLDYATERIFLRKVGGGYIFIHRLLQDYFASLSQGQ